MPLLQDRIQETSTTTGTGTLTLAGAVTGYRSFNASFTNGDVVFYTIDDTLGNWEVGYGAVGTGTLTRDAVIVSSNANALVNFGAGAKRVFCSAPTRALLPDQTGNSGKFLTTDGTSPSWSTNPLGTVTSVSGTGTVSGISLSGTVTSSGSLTLGGTLDLSAYNAAGAFTTLSASSTVSGTGFSTYLASPPAIGGTTPAAGNFTTLSSTGNTTLGDAAGDTLTINAGTTTFAGTGQRITGDFSNATIANRLAFQTSTVNGNSFVNIIPNGTATSAGFIVYSASDLSNAAFFTHQIVGGSDARFNSGITGTGTYLPMTFFTGGSERVRIDTSGNVGIGTSSPGAKLQVSGGRVKIFGDNDPYQLNLFYAPGVSGFWLGCPGANALAFYTDAGTERMRIDSSGNLGLGVTPSAWATVKALQISGGASLGGYNNGSYLYTNAYYDGSTWRYIASSVGASGIYQYNGGFSWYTASSGTAGNAITFTQAMTLDASGNLIVGDTSGPTNARFYAVHSVSNAGVGFIRGASTSYTDSVFTVSSATASGTGFNLLRLQHATGTCCQVLGNGNVQNTNNSYGAISDKSLKENIVDATPKLANLLRVKIRNFNLIGDSTKQIGVVAQELEEVFPAMVEEDGDGVKSVKYSVFVPMLVKAIQELHAEIEQLKQRIH